MNRVFPCASVEKMQGYIDDVLEGRVVVGKWERLAVERHQRDVATSEAGGRWIFDRYLAQRACNFLETLPHVKGPLAKRRETLTLEGWQCFLVCSWFGWVDRETRLRRFLWAYNEIARKNGKSFIVGGGGLYLGFMEGEPGAEVLVGASTRDQAMKLFEPTRQMALRHNRLKGEAGVRVLKYKMLQAETGSAFEVVPSQTDALDGANPHAGLIDELHVHKTRYVLDTIDSGMGAREQPMMLIITTAGESLDGPCWDEHVTVEKILERTIENDRYFGIIFTIDEDDDWSDPSVWRKANPNLGVSLRMDYLQSRFDAAKNNPAKKGEFLRKHLDVWSSAGQSAFDIDDWRAGADPAITWQSFEGADRVVLGVDGSKTDDMTAISAIREDAGSVTGMVELHATEKLIREPGNEHLARWADDGLIVEHDGAMIDLDTVELAVERILETVGAAECAYDPLYLAQMMQRLEARHEGIEFIETKGTPMALDPALRTMQGVILNRAFRHNGCPVLSWMISNARTKPAGEFVKLFKQKPMAKIDGVQATTIALTRFEVDFEPEGPSVYEERGVIIL